MISSTLHIVNSLMVQRTTTTNSTTQHWLILNSSARTHLRALLQDFQTKQCLSLQALDLVTSAVDLCNLSLKPSLNLEVRCMQPHLSLTKIGATNTRWWTMLRNLWKLQLKSLSWDHKLIQKSSAKHTMVPSWDLTWTIEQIPCLRTRWRRSDRQRRKKKVGTAS